MGDASALPQQARLEKLAKRLQWLLPLFGGSLALLILLDRLGLGDPQAGRGGALPLLAAVGLVQLASSVLCVIISAMWLHRASANLAARGAPMRQSPVAAWGWYFVPVLNLFKPFGAMKEIWNESLAAADNPDGAAPPLLMQWWGAWITGNIALSVSARIEAVGSRDLAVVLDLVGALALFAAGLLFARIVMAITRAQAGPSAAAAFA